MKRIGLIALALVLSLGLMGAGLAYWNETLTIGGTVATGTFDTEFTFVSSSDTGVDPVKLPSTNPLDLDVASCTATPSGPHPAGDPNNTGDDLITVTIDNAYPCYNPVVSFTVNNLSTIPAKIDTVTISDAYSLFSLDGGTTWVGSATIASGDRIDVDLGTTTGGANDPDGQADLHIEYTGVSADQVLDEAGGSTPSQACSLNIHVWEENDTSEGSNATENADGSFTITIETIQFNG